MSHMISVIILAIIQALTEFIPVSSSGHLFVAEQLTSLQGSLALDVALHFGTLIAVVIFFMRRIIAMCRDVQSNKVLIINLVITSIPAAIAGYLLSDFIEEDARALPVVIVMLALVGAVMIVSDRLFKPNEKNTQIEDITHTDAVLIGFGQMLALIPGTSRSGITILAARARGFSNALAAEYSFLAGIPVIGGASLRVFLSSDTRAVLTENSAQVFVGILVASVVGWFALNFLIKYLSTHSLALFGWYRLALASILFIIWLNQ
jgi:undecaprenyl-diphosphatase